MKPQTFRKGFFLLLIFPLFLYHAAAQKSELTKEYHEEYGVTENTKLILENKFGNVDIKDWDQKKITIDVLVTVEHSSKTSAEKLLEYINVEFDQAGDKITAKTVFDDRLNRESWSRGKDGKRFSIDYTVNMPRDLKLDLSNKYGDTFINELTGEALINVKYGNLKANKIIRGNVEPLSKVILKYGKGSIEEVDWLTLEVKYCHKFEINQAAALVIMSGYSKVFVSKASSIVVDSKYDNFTLGEVNNFVAESGYTGYTFDKVKNKLILTSRYGNCEVKTIPKTFEKIEINSKYGTIKLGIDPEASYQLNGEAGYGKITFPSTGKLSKISSSNSFTVDGVVGTDSSPKATVKILTKYGSVYLIE